MKKDRSLIQIYRKLYDHFGPQYWWPGDGAFEVAVGAILTQNASWSNAARAVTNLKRERLLSSRKIKAINTRKLGSVIKPSGFYNEKARKLKRFVEFLFKRSDGDISKLRSYKTTFLRKELLKIKGIGPETADSILLYALGKAVFVIDAYTKRIFARHEIIPEDATYDETQKFFISRLPEKKRLFNEYHALIVATGKSYCKKKKPLCKICPLRVVKRGKNMVY